MGLSDDRWLPAGTGPLPWGPNPIPSTVVKSPGIRPDTPLLIAAAEAGVEVIDEAELGWRIDPRPYVGVTGTNGKSTTCELIHSIFAAIGTSAVVAGNTQFGPPLSSAPDHNADVVIAELSSFQLECCPRLLPDIAVFTNLTHDHIYRHGSLAEYGACKRRAFMRGDQSVRAAAVGVDQPFGAELADQLEERGVRVVRFGESANADRRLLEARWSLDTAHLQVKEGRGHRVLETRLPGRHNALNVVGALALSDALEIDPAIASRAIGTTARLPGRMEQITGPDGRVALVDYAHNGAGVAYALQTARAALDADGTGGRLHVVVAGLDFLDEQQGFEIGAAAARHADSVVLTTQRWRTSQPFGELAPGLLAGASSLASRSVRVEVDRRTAIQLALTEAGPGDVLLVLDRGATGGLLFDANDIGRPFDDRKVVREVLGVHNGEA